MTLAGRNKIVFLPLHIKLGLMEQFVKELDKQYSVSCTRKTFLGLRDELTKAGGFDGPQIIKDPKSTKSLW